MMKILGLGNFHLFDRPSTDLLEASEDSQDMMINRSLANVHKGVKPLDRKQIMLVVACLLTVLAALAVLFKLSEGKAGFDFNGMQNYFFESLTADAGTGVQIHTLDAYFRNGRYYYDVTYTSGAEGDAIRRVYCGQDIIGISQVFDPQVLGQSKLNFDKWLYDLYSLAVEQGEHRTYTPAQIESGLKAAAGGA